jgi:hypothetical protein
MASSQSFGRLVSLFLIKSHHSINEFANIKLELPPLFKTPYTSTTKFFQFSSMEKACTYSLVDLLIRKLKIDNIFGVVFSLEKPLGDMTMIYWNRWFPTSDNYVSEPFSGDI